MWISWKKTAEYKNAEKQLKKESAYYDSITDHIKSYDSYIHTYGLGKEPEGTGL